MKRRVHYLVIFFLFISTGASILRPDYSPADTIDGFQVDTLATDLVVPWQIVFLPDNTMLFTERAGQVRIIRNDKLIKKPAYITEVVQRNKTGLLGMCIHPDFRKNRFIYLADNYSRNNRVKLKVVRYEFVNDTLIRPFTILDNLPANPNHTGCRLLFGPDRKLYITTGDADEPSLAQDLKAYNGKILRLNDDGSIPEDNPFAGHNDQTLKAIWSYGHRNPQGIAFQPGTGLLFSSEHGPTGGDEINIIKKGGNYGWPVVHHQESQEGMISPIAEYTPSIAPSEAMFYTGKAFPELEGKLLVGCLRGESILRLELKNGTVVKQDVILKQKYGRIRSLVTGPDGYIYLSTSQIDPSEGVPRPQYDMILRLKPSGDSNTQISSQRIMPRKTTAANKKNGKSPVKTGTAVLFQQLCVSCHSNTSAGTKIAGSLFDGKFKYGSGKASIIKNITNGLINKGMPSWKGAISRDNIEKIAEYILIRQRNRGSAK